MASIQESIYLKLQPFRRHQKIPVYTLPRFRICTLNKSDGSLLKHRSYLLPVGEVISRTNDMVCRKITLCMVLCRYRPCTCCHLCNRSHGRMFIHMVIWVIHALQTHPNQNFPFQVYQPQASPIPHPQVYNMRQVGMSFQNSQAYVPPQPSASHLGSS